MQIRDESGSILWKEESTITGFGLIIVGIYQIYTGDAATGITSLFAGLIGVFTKNRTPRP
jgi:hypothetical protein